MASSTRQRDEIFLIGIRDLSPISRLNQLPTVRQVLLRFHVFLSDKKSVRDASHLLIEEVIEIWNKAGIPTQQPKHCIEKLEKIHKNWLLLKKNKGRDSEAQKKRENTFVSDLDTLFDIAHASALQSIKISEDRDFLLDQRGERKMIMTSEDKKLIKKQERALERVVKAEQYKEKVIRELASTSTSSVPYIKQSGFENSSSESSDEDDTSDEFQMPYKCRKLDTQNAESSHSSPSSSTVFTKHVMSALDRNKITDREAVRLMIPLAAALGYDPNTLPISRSTIRRRRKKARIQFNNEVRGTFAPDYPLVVHWDGKILPDILGNQKVDRLPVLVSGDGEEKLLGVPKVSSGSGDQAASAVYSLLREWHVEEKVQAMSFDTTSANTGQHKGACTLLEAMMSRQLLWLACRHHIMEIILAKVFSLCFGPSNSPEIPLFKKFKNIWGSISHEDYKGLDLSSHTEELVNITLESIYNALSEEKHSRDDYQELMELTMIVLNKPPEKIHWRSPGSIHHARWMAKLLYAIKIFLFKDQAVVKLTRREETQISRFVKFGALLYTKAWIEAPLASEAPKGDLQLWRYLKKYEAIDPEIGVAARNVLERHLWYLSDELVGLSLFSDNVTPAEKSLIVSQITKSPGPRQVRGNPSLLAENVSLGDFASERTKELLSVLEIKDSFLTLPPENWKKNNDYRLGQERVKSLRVVNDTAERGVKLFEEYNKTLTKNEEEKQFILQLVERDRKNVPTQTSKHGLLKVVLDKDNTK